MALILLLGGSRSGKSSLALDLAKASGRPVTFVATAEARDGEMADRIARHRAARPKGWRTVEEPVDLRAAVAQADGDACLVIDCLSLWVANLLERGWSEEAIEEEARAVAVQAAGRAPLTVAVTNEVGLGIVPSTPLGRSYRDLLGCVNAAWGASAAEAAFVVAGRLLPLSRPENVFAELDG
jgi:adenosyl cobinamide kinase/adenosyl cobinamide phosphate guanylyltransferase